MYRVPPARAWWPAVAAPLERGVRRHSRLLHVYDFFWRILELRVVHFADVSARPYWTTFKYPDLQVSAVRGTNLLKLGNEFGKGHEGVAFERLKGISYLMGIETPRTSRSLSPQAPENIGMDRSKSDVRTHATRCSSVPRMPKTMT